MTAPASRSGPRRGLTLAEAAGYIGVSLDKFENLVATGRMPRPKLIDQVRRWDIEALDIYWRGLPDDERSHQDRAVRFLRPAPR